MTAAAATTHRRHQAYTALSGSLSSISSMLVNWAGVRTVMQSGWVLYCFATLQLSLVRYLQTQVSTCCISPCFMLQTVRLGRVCVVVGCRVSCAQ